MSWSDCGLVITGIRCGYVMGLQQQNNISSPQLEYPELALAEPYLADGELGTRWQGNTHKVLWI